MCKLWVTLDLFFCNNTCLHLAFANMDSFLRLKDPQRRGRRRAPLAPCSILLWLAASWAISLVQSIAQFMLSQADRHVVRNGVCFVGDRNFAVLGTLFSFIIPITVALLFYGLSAHEIRTLRRVGGGRLLTDDCCDETMSSTGFRYSSRNTLDNSDEDDDHDDEDDDMSETTSCVSEQPPLVREQLQLAVVTNIKNGDVNKNRVQPQSQPQLRVTDDGSNLLHDVVTSFCSAENHRDADMTSKMNGQNHSTHQVQNQVHNQVHNHVQNQNHSNFVDHILSTDQSASCTLLLRSGREEEETLRANSASNSDIQRALECQSPCQSPRTDSEVDHSPPDEALRREQSTSRLLFALLIVCISLWTPLSLSNVFYAVCSSCRFSDSIGLTFTRSTVMKWLAYSSTVAVPLVYIKWSASLRRAYVKLFTCNSSIWYKRFK